MVTVFWQINNVWRLVNKSYFSTKSVKLVLLTFCIGFWFLLSFYIESKTLTIGFTKHIYKPSIVKQPTQTYSQAS